MTVNSLLNIVQQQKQSYAAFLEHSILQLYRLASWIPVCHPLVCSLRTVHCAPFTAPHC